jgi:excisionase family DNA binding protein
MIAGKDYLRAADIAELTGMSVRTIRRWIADEILPSIKLGGARLVARADLDRLLSPSPMPHQSWLMGFEEYNG